MGDSVKKPNPAWGYDKRDMIIKKNAHGMARELAYGNTTLVEFFKKFDYLVTQVADEKMDEYAAEVYKHAEVIDRMSVLKKELESKMKKSGIILSDSLEYPITWVRVKQEYAKVKGSFSVYESFNGCRVKPEMLTPEGVEKLKSEQRIMQQRDETTIKEEMQLKKRLKKCKFKSDFVFQVLSHFIPAQIKADAQNELEYIEDRLNEIAVNRRDKERLEETITIIEGFSPKQKHLIQNYQTQTRNMVEENKAIEAVKRKAGALKLSKFRNGTSIEAFKRYIRLMQMTDEDLINFLKAIKAVVDKTNNGAFSSNIVTKKDIEYKHLEDAIAGFFMYVYDPEKQVSDQPILIERQTESSHKKENEDNDEKDDQRSH